EGFTASSRNPPVAAARNANSIMLQSFQPQTLAPHPGWQTATAARQSRHSLHHTIEAATLELLHHLAHLFVLLEQTIQILHIGAGTLGDTPFPRSIEYIGIAPFSWC